MKLICAILFAIIATSSFSQIEKFEKVALTRYFKPQIKFLYIQNPKFLDSYRTSFFNELKQNDFDEKDYRNLLDFSNIHDIEEVEYQKLPDVPVLKTQPSKGMRDLLESSYKFYFSPILKYIYKSKVEKATNLISTNEVFSQKIQNAAKDRLKEIFGFYEIGYFDTQNLLQEARKHSNDLDDSIAYYSVNKNTIYTEIAEELISRNFIIVYNLKEALSFSEYYQINNTPEYKQLNNGGMKVKVECYVFRLKWTNKAKAYFYNKCWVNNENDLEALENFENFKIPLELIYITEDDAIIKEKLRQKLSDKLGFNRIQVEEQAFFNVTQNIHNNILLNVDHFKLRGVLYKDSSNKFKSKLGTKEGLTKRDRYVVYEIGKNEFGEYKKHYRGVVRSRKPVENFTNKTKSTIFYQERGKPLYNGMLIEQQKLDILGGGVSFGFPLDKSNELFWMRYSLGAFRTKSGFNIDLFGVQILFGKKNPDIGRNISMWSPSFYKEFRIKGFPYLQFNLGLGGWGVGVEIISGITLPIRSNFSFYINPTITLNSYSNGLNINSGLYYNPNLMFKKSKNFKIVK